MELFEIELIKEYGIAVFIILWFIKTGADILKDNFKDIKELLLTVLKRKSHVEETIDLNIELYDILENTKRGLSAKRLSVVSFFNGITDPSANHSIKLSIFREAYNRSTEVGLKNLIDKHEIEGKLLKQVKQAVYSGQTEMIIDEIDDDQLKLSLKYSESKKISLTRINKKEYEGKIYFIAYFHDNNNPIVDSNKVLKIAAIEIDNILQKLSK